MIARICWFPFLSFCFLLFLTHYLPSEHPEWHYSKQDLATINIVLRAAFSAVCLTGVYRYLLGDTRFHIKTVALKRNLETRQPVLSTRLYFALDKSVIILAIVFAGWSFLYHYGNRLAANLIVSDSLPAPVTTSDIMLLKAWQIFFFFLGSQLCLIFPYIAVSKNITFSKIVQNIQTLRGNRIRVWAVQAFILACFIGGEFALSWVLYLLYRHTPLGEYRGSGLMILGYVLDIIAWFIGLLLSAIFCAAAFKALGVRENELPIV